MRDFLETAREIEEANGPEVTKSILANFCDYLLRKTFRQKVAIISLVSAEAITIIAFILYAVIFK